MKKSAFIEVSLSDVIIIMEIMCVPVEELLYQVPTGRILVLKYLLSGAHGCL
jgi:hypothetical protein